jgi:glycogen debranching enzyme
MPDPATLLEVPVIADKQVGELNAAQNLKGTLSLLKGLFTGDHLNASGGPHFSNKNFGRDSAISMLFLLDNLKHSSDPEVEKETRFIIEKGIQSLIRWQGGKDAKINGHWRKNAEEKGKIHHEAGPVAIDKLGLVEKWQDSDDSHSDMLVYFGSVDATPLYVKLVCEYIELVRKLDSSPQAAYEFLMSKAANFRGGELTISQSLAEAAGWIERQLKASELGFLEYYRKPGQEQGIPNQVWKDSLTSYVHLNGELANTKAPIASIEVQALAYDALLGVAEIFDKDQILARATKLAQHQVDHWRAEADSLRQRLFRDFWIEPEQRFVQAIDRQPKTGEMRQIKTPSSNELHLLNSRLFDDLSEKAKKPYLSSLIHQAFNDDFLTDIGIRCRARSRNSLISFADYHGSWAVWPWESHWIALGLRRQGLPKLADQVDIRIMNSFIISGQYTEFYMVNPINQRVYYRFVAMEPEKQTDETLKATNLPDTPQTWSATAAIDIHGLFTGHHEEKLQPEWLARLEQEMLYKIGSAELIPDDHELAKIRAEAPVAVVDLAGGKTADKQYYATAGQLEASIQILAG